MITPHDDPPKVLAVTPAATASGKRCLDIRGAAKFTSLAKRTIRRHLEDDRSRFPRPFKFGGKLLWTVDSLEKWAERMMGEAQQKPRVAAAAARRQSAELAGAAGGAVDREEPALAR